MIFENVADLVVAAVVVEAVDVVVVEAVDVVAGANVVRDGDAIDVVGLDVVDAAYATFAVVVLVVP